jgi:flagellar biosynthetic protein FliO
LKNILWVALFLYAAGFSFAQDAEGVPDGITRGDTAESPAESPPVEISADNPAIDAPEALAATGTAVTAETELLFAEPAVEAPVSTNTSIFVLLRVVLVLGLVAAAIYGLVFLLKKQSALRVETDPYLKVLARTALTPKTAAVVVSVGDKAWLAGVTDEQVALITEITDKEVVDAMLLDAANREIAAQSRRIDFRALLAKLSGSIARSQPRAEPPAAASGIRAQADRLGRL